MSYKDIEKRKETDHKRRIVNRTRQREYDRKYRIANREAIRKTYSKWFAANRKKKRKLDLKWLAANPEKAQANRYRRRAKKKKHGGTYTAQDWINLCIEYDWRCLSCCKCVLTLALLGRKLVPDHVLPISKGGANIISNLQPLCHGVGGCNNHKSARHVDYRNTWSHTNAASPFVKFNKSEQTSC